MNEHRTYLPKIIDSLQWPVREITVVLLPFPTQTESYYFITRPIVWQLALISGLVL